jgi:predicted GNAT family acetyltransferase
MSDVEDNIVEHRFELPIDGTHEVASAYYRNDGGKVVLTHTIVPERFSGQGLGAKLARGTFDAIRASGRKAILRCPFMAAFYTRHPEYADIVATES